MANYHQLNGELVIDSIRRLQGRVKDRFPDSGLSKVCLEMLNVAKRSKETVETIERPQFALRAATSILAVGIGILILGLLLGIADSKEVRDLSGWFGTSHKNPEPVDYSNLLQGLDAVVNMAILFCGAIFFFLTMETRIKRRRALKVLHELRVMAHVIDMHQLTKDPERLLSKGPPTASSPQRTMTAFELGRYLDYCSEMLSLVGKIATLYAQHFDDSVALSAVNEIEQLTTGLSRKIWQKIMLLHPAERSSSECTTDIVDRAD